MVGDAGAPVRVIDGDTIAIGEDHVRLFGIDAPEKAQTCEVEGIDSACGDDATRALEQLIGTSRPTCVERSRDRYGRAVAVCSVSGRDLGREMVANGWAVAFTRYSQDYVTEEAAAKAERRGLWQGRFERPDVWRAERR